MLGGEVQKINKIIIKNKNYDTNFIEKLNQKRLALIASIVTRILSNTL